MPATQLQLLRQTAPHVRLGGLLVYSTCSLEPEENEQVVRAFLQTVPGFALEHERILLPFVDGVDGAYVARLRRKA
jgi:16S rRNA (cytosine967-C5)-methyltransferase